MSDDTIILSILIVNWNTRDYLLGALKSIYDNPPESAFETIVVDNASADGSAEAAVQNFPHVRMFAMRENTGYAAGNNLAMRESRGQNLLLLNPDVVLREGALDHALELLASRENVSALAPRLVNPDGTVQNSLRGFPTPLSVLFEALGLSRLFVTSRLFGAYRMTWFHYDIEIPADQPMGTFLLIPRYVYETIGPMDEQFPIFFNEVDWLWRAKQQGFRALFTPEVEVVHYGGASTRQAAGKMVWESRHSLLAYYRKQYKSPLFTPVYLIAVFASWVDALLRSRRREREASS